MSKLRSLCAAASASAMVFSTVNGAQATPVSGQGTWETTLQARDINGDGVADAFYDTVLNVTWLADANAAAGGVFDNGDRITDGQMTWPNAKTWAAELNVYGLTGWRLPTIIDTGIPGCGDYGYVGTDCGFNVKTISADGLTVYSELAHLFFTTLGNSSSCDAAGICSTSPESPPDYWLSNTGPLRNMQAWAYWTGMAYEPDPRVASWGFYTYFGYQAPTNQSFDLHALAVRPGDVITAVPEPQTVALMLLGFAAMVMVQRKRAIRRFDTLADSAV